MNSISPSAFNLAMDAVSQGGQSKSLTSGSMLETPEQLAAVAEQFEAIFVKAILSSARSAELSDPLLNSEGQKTFTQMLDAEYAGALAQRESLGIADGIVRQFQNRIRNGDAD
ncbi:MAG: rod-binding protein [Loktanella sp.]|nr:rod-binding protein [Loktanella sp.]